MKIKTILMLLLFMGIALPTQAQFLKKLKKKAEQAAERTVLKKTDEIVTKKTEKTIDDATSKKETTKDSQQKQTTTAEPSNTAVTINTEAKKAFFKEDVIIQLHENGTLNQTQYFDADEIAVRLKQDDMPEPGFIDSEGFIYVFKNGEYVKSSMIALQSQGLMVPTMLLDAYKLPREPFMAQFQKQSDLGVTANPFNGIVEFAFIYKPDDFRYEDFKETKQRLRGESYTKFEFLNEPGYEGSYVLFDDQDRLVEIYTKISESKQDYNIGEMPREQGESLMLYNYEPVNVVLPQAREVKTQGQNLMEGVMKNIVKGGDQSKMDIDEDDYDTSDSKGMTKRILNSQKNHKITAEDLPDSYVFDWELQMDMTLNSKKKEVLNMTYLIKEGVSYQATKIISEQTQNMGMTTMIFDMELMTTLMLMEMQENKIIQINPIPDTSASKHTNSEYTITELSPKNIIGYSCKGLKIEDEKYIMNIYYTSDAGVKASNFLNFGAQKSAEYPAMDSEITKQFSNGLVLEMDIVDKKKSKNNVNIIAKALKQTKTIIKPSDYKPMNFMSGSKMFKN